jgi:hypothetical protein
MDQRLWAAVVMGLAFMGLVALMFVEAVNHDFATIWAGVGTVVGVVTGAIPSYFFHTQASDSTKKLNALLAEAPPDVVERARTKWVGAFK